MAFDQTTDLTLKRLVWRERCTQQFARSAVLILWFPSDPVATAQSTAAIASGRCEAEGTPDWIDLGPALRGQHTNCLVNGK